MRAAAIAALVLFLSGCLGGCYTDSYRLVWEDEAIARMLRGMAGQANVTSQEAGVGLPLDAALLPVHDGNATLARIEYAWPAETPELDVSYLSLRATREGGIELSGLVDAHLGRDRFGQRLDVLLAAVLAGPADAAELRSAALADYDPGPYDFSDFIRVPVNAQLRLDLLVADLAGPWMPQALGQWEKVDGSWMAEARLTSWTFRTPDGLLAADAGGHIEGPALDGPGRLHDEAAPARSDLEATTALVLARVGVQGPPGIAQVQPAGRVCVD